MRVDKYTMAQSWMRQDDATPEEAKATWDTLEIEFEDKRKAQLMASAETDAIIKTINDKFGPGTMFPASEAPIPPMTDTQAVMEWEDRNRKAGGGKIIGKPGGLVEPGVKYYGVSLREGDLLNPYRVTLKTSEGQIDQHFATETEAYEFYDKKEAEALKKGTKSRASTRYITKLATEAMNEYNKIIDHAVNNRKVKNFSEPFEIIFKDKKYKFTEIPTIKDFIDKVNPDQPNHLKLKKDYFTKYGVKPALTKENAFIKIVNDTVKLNNDTFTFSTVDDIAEDIGYKKGSPGGVIDLFEGNKIIKPFNKDEIVSKYIQHLVDKDAPLKDFTSESIFRHVNNRRNDLIKKNKDSSLSIPGTKRTIEAKNISKIMKADHPELFAKIGRDGQIPFLSRSIQNKTDLGNMRLSEAFQTTESGDIFFNEAKAKNINLKRALASITAETDILQGKLNLDQRSLAISNAQDKMVEDLNKYIRENTSVILDNPQFRKLAATRFEDGKFIIDEDPKLINDRLNRYIKSGFFSTDHKVSKRTGKLNVEFPTNKQIVPTFINGPIRSMENYIANNISKYNLNTEEGRIIKNNIDEIVNVAKTNNFTVNVPKGHSNIFGTNRTNVGAIQDIATVSADGKVLTSYDNQLKKFNFDIDKIPEISNVKNIDYKEVDKSRLQKTLDTKLKTAEGYKKSINQLTGGDPKLNKFVMQNFMPSGLSGAYELLSDDLKKIVNSKAFKTWEAKIANPAITGASKTLRLGSKIFGVADLALGYLDYSNNRQKGWSVEDSKAHMIETMLFGFGNMGEEADTAGVKKVAMEKYNMSSEVFDQLVATNENQNEVKQIITDFAAQNKDAKERIESGMGNQNIEYGILTKNQKDSQERLKVLMAEAIEREPSLKTNLQVQEAGAPIDINVDKGKALGDLSKASYDFVQKRIKDSDLEKLASQKDTTKGGIGDTTWNTLQGLWTYPKFAYDVVNPFSPLPEWGGWKTKGMTHKDQMEKLKIEDPTMYYKMLLSEGVDPRMDMNIPVHLEWEQKYGHKFGSPISDEIKKSTSYFDGGIASLRRKK